MRPSEGPKRRTGEPLSVLSRAKTSRSTWATERLTKVAADEVAERDDPPGTRALPRQVGDQPGRFQIVAAFRQLAAWATKRAIALAPSRQSLAQAMMNARQHLLKPRP